jgi:hypothetical protein
MDSASAARPEPWICPFLRAGAADGTLGDPIRWPDEANRCTAFGDAAPQSLRQQEYACLASAHVNCPRFVRGANLLAEAPPATGAGLQLTPAVVAALLVLAASFALSVGFVVANGGMDLPANATRSPQAAFASVAPGGDPSAEPAASTSVEPSVEPIVEPTPTASVDAASATPTPAATTTTGASPSPRPSSDRYALLHACPDEPDCWIYTVRSGDNLVSIARYFGVALEVVTEINPWTTTTQLVAGQELRLPPPTR